MMFVTAATFLIASLVGTALVEGQTCKFTLQSDLNPKKEPLVLSIRKTGIRGGEEDVEEVVDTLVIANPKVVDGNKGVISVHDKDKLMLACPGKDNKVTGNGQDQAYLKCEGGKFTIDGKEANVDSTSCSKSYARSWMKETDETCGSGDDTGKILQLGFLLTDKSWFPLIELCHNTTRGVTLYASHTIAGHSLRGAEKCSDRKGFSKGLKSLYPGIDPIKIFNKAGQRKAFKQILGLKQYSTYLSGASFLARGHLAPDADFIFNSEQLSTYYLANTAPQWQDFNAGNWLVVENAVRDLAAKEALSIEVYTGTWGILELLDSTNHKRDMYLAPDEKMVPVPKVFWKIVQHPITKACTVAVGHNNVFLKNPPKPICPPKTPDGWPKLDDLKKGYTYYCDYEGFVKTVSFAPDNDCKDLFEFPEKQ